MKLNLPICRIINFEKDYVCKKMKTITNPNIVNGQHFCSCCITPQKCYTVKNLYACDYCDEMYEDIVLNNPTQEIEFYKSYENLKDVCSLCLHKYNLFKEKDESKLELCYDTILYTIDKQVDINETTSLYVIYEFNNCGNQYNNYVLLCIDNNKVILRYILDSYNPYFGIKVKNIFMNDDGTLVTILYREKHENCNVTLKVDRENYDKEYLINGILCKKQVGEVIEFICGDEKHENKNYFNCKNVC